MRAGWTGPAPRGPGGCLVFAVPLSRSRRCESSWTTA